MLIGLLLLGTVAGSVGAVTPSETDPSPDVGTESVLLQVSSPATTDTNNSSVQHTDPDDADGDGDLDAVRRWLAGQMTQVLIDCTERVRTADRVACSQLDESYPDWLSKFVDVAGDTPSQDDDEVAQRLNESRQHQSEFVQSVNEYRETLDQYRQARENGNSSRARELAREISADAAEVNESGSDLRTEYSRLTDGTDANMSASSETVAETAENATETAAEIRAQELRNTTLQVTANRTDVGFERPIKLSGTLTTESGEPIADRTVALTVGTQQHNVQTDSQGRFALTYRPTLLSLSTNSLRVGYQPNPTSLYGMSNATVPVQVSQTNTDVTLTITPQNASFGDSVRVSGTVRSAGMAVQDVPVSVTLGRSEQMELRTDEEGRFVENASIPANLSAGNVTVQASLDVQRQALNRSTDRATVVIRTTNTSLSLSKEPGRASEPTLTGHLHTDSGTPVSGETVRLRVNGTTADTVETNATGAFETTIDLSSVSADSAIVTAVYAPERGNLESSRAQLEVGLPETADGETRFFSGVNSMLPFGIDLWDVIALVVVLLVLGIGRAALREPTSVLPARLSDGFYSPSTGTTRKSSVDAGSNTSSSSPESNPRDSSDGDSTEPTLSDTVTSQLERGETDAAVITAYELLRRRAHEEFDADPSLTHWELFEAIDSELTGAESVGLNEFIDAYEIAAFAPESVSNVRAADVTAAVQTFVAQTDQF